MSKSATMGDGRQLLQIADDKGLGAAEMEPLLRYGYFAGLCEAAKRGLLTREGLDAFLRNLGVLLTIAVNMGLDLATAVAAGKYDWINDSFIGAVWTFVQGCECIAGEQEVVWVDFDFDPTTEQVLAKMEAEGLRPGNHLELLAVGAAYPDLQQTNPLVALGSSCTVGEYTYVAVLNGFDAGRNLHLNHRGDKWDRDCRFLAFRIKK